MTIVSESPRKKRVYLAARFSRLEELLGYKAELEADGIEVTSRWLLGGHEWEGIDDQDIPLDRAGQFGDEDLDDINAADVIVCFTEPPRSSASRGGRHFEAGWAAAMGMPLVVVGPRENVFYARASVIQFDTWDQARSYLVPWLVPVEAQ